MITSPLSGRQRIAISEANGAQPTISRNGGTAEVHPLVYAHDPANTTLQSLFGNFNGRVRSIAIYRSPVDATRLQRMSAL